MLCQFGEINRRVASQELGRFIGVHRKLLAVWKGLAHHNDRVVIVIGLGAGHHREQIVGGGHVPRGGVRGSIVVVVVRVDRVNVLQAIEGGGEGDVRVVWIQSGINHLQRVVHKSRGIYGKLVVLDGAGEEIKVDVLSEGQDVAGVHALIRHGVDELKSQTKKSLHAWKLTITEDVPICWMRYSFLDVSVEMMQLMFDMIFWEIYA